MSLFPEIDKHNREYRAKERDKIQKIKDSLRDESKLYRPSDGQEGYLFEQRFCSECKKDNPEKGKFCKILFSLHAGDFHEDLVSRDGTYWGAICFQDSNFNKKYSREVKK